MSLRVVFSALPFVVLLGTLAAQQPVQSGGLSGVRPRIGLPERLLDVKEGTGAPLSAESFLASPVPGDSRFYFVGCEPSLGCEVHVTDGTEEGTRLLRDVQPGPCNLFMGCGSSRLGFPSVQLVPFGERVLFNEIWDLAVPETSDVASVHAVGRLYDVHREPIRAVSAAHVSFYSTFVTHGGLLFFAGAPPTRPGEYPRYGLWRTDGTPGGTYELQDGFPITALEAFGKVYVSTANGLFVTDGSRAGTRKVEGTPANRALTGGHRLRGADGREVLVFHDLEGRIFRIESPDGGLTLLASLGSRPLASAVAGSVVLVFRAGQLWRSDGTVEGTRLLKYVAHTFEHGFVLPADRRVVSGGRLFFVANEGGASGRDQLWVSDGTEAGTRLVLERKAGDYFPSIEQLTALDGGVAFVARDADGHRVVLRSDGTPQGTSVLTSEAGEPRALTNVHGTLWFSGAGGLWSSRGKTALTIRRAHGASSRFESSTYLPGRVLLGLAEDREDGPSHVLAVERNGRTAGTVSSGALGESIRLVPGGTLAGRALVSGCAGDASPCLRITDGTPGGTDVLRRELDVLEAAPLGRRLLLSRRPPGHGGAGELWTTDGTSSGTARVAALPLRSDAWQVSATSLRSVGDRVVFVLDHAGRNQALFSSDGTPAGTHPIGELSLFPSRPTISSSVAIVGTSGSRAFATRVTLSAYPSREEAFLSTDGTIAGTRVLALLASDGGFVVGTVNGRALLALQSGADALLWNGTPFRFLLLSYDVSSGRLEDLGCFASSSGARDLQLTNVGSLALFAAADLRTGRSCGAPTGTAAGTFRVTDLASGPFPSSPEVLAVLDDRLLLLAGDGEHGREPWSLPLRALDARPGDTSSLPCDEP